ncbi:alkaline phosphatase D family protein [Salinispora vitiensis]|uniref:alkaline phosphatase D family protein n=1 Tax=Salinispora vitiensis TaxID=999544 RepID=UPI0003609221|nr:alkaline phosphatase D family protein [Salinispora vitiensis]
MRLTNSFETGLPPGTTVTTGNSGEVEAGNPFTLSTDSAASTCVYSGVGARGLLCMSVGVQSPAGPSRRGWAVNPLAVTNAQYYRLYVDPGTITGTLSVLRGMNTGSTGQRFRLSVSADGIVTMYNKSNVVVWVSAALAAGTWWRVEASVEGFDARPCQVQIFAGDAITPTQDSGVITGDFGGPITEVWFGQTNAAFGVAGVLDDLGYSDEGWLGPAALMPTVLFSWAGALTDHTATVTYALQNVSSVRLAVSQSPTLISPVHSADTAVDADGFVKITVSGLDPDTTHWYGLEANGMLLDTGRGLFTTDPTPGTVASFSVAFGSCNQTNSNAATFAQIAARQGPYGLARRILHEGDLHYRDPGAGWSTAEALAQYRTSMSQPTMQTMTAAVPMLYVWDNHDWGGTDSDSTSPAGPVNAAAYRQVVPHYPLATAGSTAIYQSMVIGRIRFIVLDTRSQRTPRTDPESASKTLLGAEQKGWLYDQLLQPEPVKIIVSGIYWRHDSAGGDRWGSYATEFQEIRQWIADRPQVQAFVIFGDRHALAADDGSSPGCYLPQAGGAPLDQGSTQQFELWSHGYWAGTPNTNLMAFGWLDIHDSGASITISYSGISASDGQVRVSMSTPFTAAPPLEAIWGYPL